MKVDWSITSTDNTTKSILFNIDSVTSKISGVGLLCQKIVKRILTAKGSNVFTTSLGTNFFNLFGAVDLREAEKVREIIPILIEDLTQQIKSEQIEALLNNEVLEDSEILKSIDLVSIEFDKIFGGWLLTLDITTKTTTTTLSIP